MLHTNCKITTANRFITSLINLVADQTILAAWRTLLQRALPIILLTFFNCVQWQHSSDTQFFLPVTPSEFMPMINITGARVRSLISSLDIRKVHWPDELSSYRLKVCSINTKTAIPRLTLVMQASLDRSRVSHDWRTANTIPIFKNGRRSSSKNSGPSVSHLSF